MTNKRLTSEAKYLLIRLLYLSDSSFLLLTNQDIAKKLGLSDAVLRKTRNLLLELGYVTGTGYQNVTTFGNTRGRPRIGFQLSHLFFGELDNIVLQNDWLNSLHPEHQLRLDKLLLWQVGLDELRSQNVKKIKKTQDDRSRIHTFTAATRVLLAVLYMHADVCGVVRSLGLVEVSKLTGMSSDRLESQLGIIEKMGYLLSRVSGITHCQIFGHAKGIFFLNVCSDNLAGIEAPSLWLALSSKTFNHYNEYYLGFRVYKYINDLKDVGGLSANYISSLIKSIESDDTKCDYYDVDWSDRLPYLLQNIRKLLEEKGLYFRVSKNYKIDATAFYAGVFNDQMVEWLQLFAPYKLHNFFSGEETVSLLKYLHSQIDYYASILLEKSWRQIKLEVLYVDESVLREIEVKIFPFKDKRDSLTDSSQKKAFIFLIYCFSYQHALIIKALVSCALPKEINFDQAKFALLPIKLKRPYWGTSFLISIHLVEQKERVEKIWAVQFGGKKPKETSDIKPYCVRLFKEECVEAFKLHGYDLKVLNHNHASFYNN